MAEHATPYDLVQDPNLSAADALTLLLIYPERVRAHPSWLLWPLETPTFVEHAQNSDGFPSYMQTGRIILFLQQRFPARVFKLALRRLHHLLSVYTAEGCELHRGKLPRDWTLAALVQWKDRQAPVQRSSERALAFVGALLWCISALEHLQSSDPKAWHTGVQALDRSCEQWIDIFTHWPAKAGQNEAEIDAWQRDLVRACTPEHAWALCGV